MKTKKAAGLTAAPKNERQRIAYRNATPMSRTNLKESIGTLLLYLQSPLTAEQQQNGWLLFEVLLSRFVQEQYAGGEA